MADTRIKLRRLSREQKHKLKFFVICVSPPARCISVRWSRRDGRRHMVTGAMTSWYPQRAGFAERQAATGSTRRTQGTASLRGGGATWLYETSRDLGTVRWRGRWAAARTLEVYIQMIAANRSPIQSGGAGVAED